MLILPIYIYRYYTVQYIRKNKYTDITTSTPIGAMLLLYCSNIPSMRVSSGPLE